MAPAGLPTTRWWASCVVKIMPKMATPTELPIERTKVAPLVAVPRSR
jgi:hypothetical protein